MRKPLLSEEREELEAVNLPRPAVPLRHLRWRWALAAAVMGAVSALAAALVRLSFSHLQWVFTGSTAVPPVAAAHLWMWRRLAVPVAGALVASAVVAMRRWRAHRLGREPRPYVEYVEAVRHEGGVVPLVPNCWRTLSAAFSIASGAAVGREGSMIQFAAAVASSVGTRLQRRFPGDMAVQSLDLRLLVAFGVAGGVTAAYNAPVAAVFFAVEIVLGAVDWRELPLLALAAGAGRLATGPLLGWRRLYPTAVTLHGQGWPLLWLPLVALLFGLAGPLYQELIRGVRAARRLPVALAWSGLLVGLLSMHDPRVWGNGDLGLSAALGHAELPGLSIAVPALATLLGLRLLATSVCVSTGTVGGVFTPTLFAGGATGALLGHLVLRTMPATATGHGGTVATLWAIVGMSCLMAAVTHAPVMAACMAAELTGTWVLLPGLLLLNLIAWQVAKRLSPHALYAIASQSPGGPATAPATAPARYKRPRTA